MHRNIIFKDSAKIVFATSFFIFVIVPLVTNYFSISVLIYLKENVGIDVIITNCVALIIFYMIVNLKSKANITDDDYLYTKKNIYGKTNIYSLFITFLIFTWLLLYIYGGGLSYRIDDVKLGYESRSSVLNLSFMLMNVIIVFLTSMICTKNKITAACLISIFTCCMILSGSRGYLVILLISLMIAKGLMQNQGLLTVKMVIIILLLLPLLAAWGLLRDNNSDFLFSMMHRLSEPYWFFAYESKTNQPDLILFTFERISLIFTKLLGNEVTYSIDGSNYLIEKYLKIEYVEGISLPITFIGEGYLFDNVFGPVIAILIVSFFLRLYLGVLLRIDLKNYQLNLGLKAFLISKLFFIYSKSISGVFLYLFYEGLRDYLVILVFANFYRLFKKNEVSK